MADKTYSLNFLLSDGSTKKVQFTAPQGPQGVPGPVKGESIYYIEGTGTTDGTWLGTCSDITEYYDGLTIAYKIGIAGASTTTLNINNLGAKTVRRATANLTTQLAVDTVVHLTYSTINGTGYWVWANYDSGNTKVTQSQSSTATGKYPVLLSYYTQDKTTTTAQTVRRDNNFYYQASTGTLTVDKVDGAMSKAITFTGAVNGTYDGSSALTVNIPVVANEISTHNSDTTAHVDIRGDVNSLLSMTEEVDLTVRTINLNPGGYEYGTFTGSSGVENNSMSPITVSFRSADYIPVNGGRSIAIYYDAYEWNKNNKGLPVKVVEYDADKNILVSNSSVNPYTVSNTTLTLNANTAFIRIALDKWAEVTTPLNEILIAIYYAEEAVKEYIPYAIGETRRIVSNNNIHDPLRNKKIVYDGDSICSSEGYAKIIAEMTGGMCTNKAVGGSRLASASGKRSVVDNLANLPTDGDLYCFQAGINDFWAGTAVGTCDRSSYTNTVDPTTICGAMETIFRYCLANFVGKPVCFIITHKVKNTSYSKINNVTFWDYRDAMIQVCQKYSIPYYDAFAESGLNGWDTNQSNAYLTGADGTADGTHPNEEGYKRYYVPQLLALFRKIMPV